MAKLKNTYVTKPTGNVIINNNNTFTKSVEVLLTLMATDNGGVVGYFISDSDTIPLLTDEKWVLVIKTKNYIANIPYTLTVGDGIKTVYVWFRDIIGNISEVAKASIILDTLAPTVEISPTAATTYITTAIGNEDFDIVSMNLTLGKNKVIIVPTDAVSKIDKAVMTVVYAPVKK